MDKQAYDLLERVLIHEALSQTEESYPFVDLENASEHGCYCRVRIQKQPEIHTFRLDLGKLESFRML